MHITHALQGVSTIGRAFPLSQLPETRGASGDENSPQLSVTMQGNYHVGVLCDLTKDKIHS